MEATKYAIDSDDGEHQRQAQARKQYVAGFVNHIIETYDKLPSASPRVEDRIVYMSDLIARARSKVERSFREREIVYKPQAEVGTRLSTVLYKLARCLYAVVGQGKHKTVLDIVHKIALDTAESFELTVLRTLAEEDTVGEGLSRKQIAGITGLKPNTVAKRLEDMKELKILQSDKRPNNSGARGRHLHVYRLTDDLKKLWRKAGFGKRREKSDD